MTYHCARCEDAFEPEFFEQRFCSESLCGAGRMSDEFQFVEELPPAPEPFLFGQDDKFVRFRKAMEDKPGQWAIYPSRLTPASAQITVKKINDGERMVYPADQFEAI